jgi:hypothetical protein
MKKPIFISIIFFVLGLSGFSQNIDFTIKVDTISAGSKANITISITEGNPEYVFSIATEAPWKGGKIIQETGIQTEKNYVFENIPYGRYFIMVKDKYNKKASYQYITVPIPK